MSAAIATGSSPPYASHRSTSVQPGLVDRERLLQRLLGARDVPLVVLLAPAGYGKTTLLCQWAQCDARPFRWLEREEVADAVDGLEAPSVLVVDDAHLGDATDAGEAVLAALAELPHGSQIALAARREPALPLGRLRAHRGMLELRSADLAMHRGEAAALVSSVGLRLRRPELETLMRRTEGWAAGLYLAALSLRTGRDDGALARFGGDDRMVADYLRDEVLSELAADDLEFVVATSVLDRLSGPVCDAVSGRARSARRLRRLSRSNLLVLPLDHNDESYRYHPLLLDHLRAELRRRDRHAEPELHRLASGWYAQNGDVDAALQHALAAGDVARGGALLWGAAGAWAARGRNAALESWLDRFTDGEIATTPTLTVTAALSHLANGQGDLVERWAAAARPIAGTAGRGPRTATLELLSAALGRNGVAAMTERAAAAGPFTPPDSPGRAMRCLVVGVGLQLSGEGEKARFELEAGVRHGALAAPALQALCLAQLALLAIDHDDWHAAAAHAERALGHVRRGGLRDYPTMALVHAVSAEVRARRGQIEAATEDAARARLLMARLRDFAPWYEAETRIALARTALRLTDVAGARRLLVKARRFLRRTPDAIVLAQWADEASAAADAFVSSGGVGAAALTTAELRVLQSLPTHLSLREIAAAMRVSENTVKTQAHAIYRKLDASSRSGAVDRARALGLLEVRRAA
ncbi:MAG: LuxR C-terminal-related transcriptional regulator [Solirubrobacteraceae bacterium]